MSDNEEQMKKAFKQLFGEMYLSESRTALQIFEYGYKAGAAAENEACATLCDEMADRLIDDGATGVDGAGYCAAEIRERTK